MPVSSLFPINSTVRQMLALPTCFLETGKYAYCSLFRTVSAVPKRPGARGRLEREGGTGRTYVPGHGSAVEKDSWALLQPWSQCETHYNMVSHPYVCVWGGGSNSLVHLVNVGEDRAHPSHQRTVNQGGGRCWPEAVAHQQCAGCTGEDRAPQQLLLAHCVVFIPRRVKWSPHGLSHCLPVAG